MQKKIKNFVDASITLPELTLRACLLSVVITVLFTASNIYLGLKIGLTFSAAIPAAVISMAILRKFKHSNILENTSVQTFTSAAGTLSAVVYVLPAMIMVGFWQDFPYWQIMLICSVGGILGVLFSIPLRRALVVQGDLPYPEGVAAAEILNAGHSDHLEVSKNEPGIKDILWGSLVASVFTLCARGFHFLSESLSYYLKVGGSVFSFATDCSLALVGAGYIIGIRVGIAMFLGTVISWFIFVPYFSAHSDMVGTAGDIANTIWATKVRFIGAGTIAVAAIWTIILLLKPIWTGIQASFQAIAQIRLSGKESILRTERDISIKLVLWGVILLTLPLLAMFGYFIYNEHLPMSSGSVIVLVLFSVIFVLFISFITASVAGYMAGLVGTSNTPISSISILTTICASCLLVLFLHPAHHSHFADLTMALTIYITAVVLAIGSISNDNLQDLKTGQMIGATPWRQQVALIYGILIGSLVVPVVLQLLYGAYGFVGNMPHAGMDPSQALSAPQAMLVSALAKAIVSHTLDWQMILIGVSIAVAFLIFDATVLKRYNARLSLIAVGIGIYLPLSMNMSIIAGAVMAYLVDRFFSKKAKAAKKDVKEACELPQRRGVLFASGLIVGESLLGVLIAFLVIVSGKQFPLSLVGDNFESIAVWLGFFSFLGALIFNYYYITRKKADADEK